VEAGSGGRGVGGVGEGWGRERGKGGGGGEEEGGGGGVEGSELGGGGGTTGPKARHKSTGLIRGKSTTKKKHKERVNERDKKERGREI